MAKPYVEVYFDDSDRSSGDASYYPQIVVGRRTFIPDFNDVVSPHEC